MENQTLTIQKNIIYILLGTGLILLIPFIAMQLTTEVNWTASDFIIAGILLLGTGFTYELLIKRIRNSSYKVIGGIILILALILTWIELAVGIFGSPIAGS